MNDGIYESNSESVQAQINGVALSEVVDTIVYSFTVNDSSGIYSKCYLDKEKTEAHIITSKHLYMVGILLANVFSIQQMRSIRYQQEFGKPFTQATDNHVLCVRVIRTNYYHTLALLQSPQTTN